MNSLDFSGLFEAVKHVEKRRLVVANGIDSHSLEAVAMAVKMGIVSVTITGDSALIKESCNALSLSEDLYQIVPSQTETEAVTAAVALARSGAANLIMKGMISTDLFMKAILNKEQGLLEKGSLLTHLTMMINPNYHKPLLVSDVAIIPLPVLEQKVQICRYLIETAHRLGINRPKVAFIAATEKVIEKMPATTDAFALKQMWEQGLFAESACDGPMALDVAIDREAALIKNIVSEVAGDADCLLFPNIEAGNVFYKVNTKLCQSKTAAIVVGTKVPTVLSSRGDDTETKLNSIALAALLG
jgi:phosphotransacetylase